MPRNHTDSSIVEYHDDGTWTETTTITYHPPTKAQKAGAWAALAGMGLIAVAPLGFAVADVVKDWREERRQRKLDQQDK